MDKQQMIDKYFNTTWSVEDFFYAYCQNKGIDDPEKDLTEEEYNKLWKECEEKITYELLRGLRDVITEDINERLVYAMDD